MNTMQDNFKFVEVMSNRIFCDELQKIDLSSKQMVIATTNAYSYYQSTRDLEFKNALTSADILLPDGFPWIWAARILKRKKIKKIAGWNIFQHLIGIANEKNLKVFFLGSSTQTLGLIQEKMQQIYPNVQIASFSPPYMDVFTKAVNEEIIELINQQKPDILFVGMTAPKQERWVHQHAQYLNPKIICSIGAVFDFFAGKRKRPSDIWIHLHMEWLGRFLQEPSRLWRRYFVYSPQFFFHLLLYFLKIKK